jgi:hypothetical protein
MSTWASGVNREKVFTSTLPKKMKFFEGWVPIIGPLLPYEEVFIFKAREYLIKETPLQYPTPLFEEISDSSVADVGRYHRISQPHNHPELDKASQVFHRRFGVFYQMALYRNTQLWLSKNPDPSTPLQKVITSLKKMKKDSLRIYLESSDLLTPLIEFQERFEITKNLMKKKVNHKGPPFDPDTWIIQESAEHKFFSGRYLKSIPQFTQLDERQLVLAMIAAGVWLPPDEHMEFDEFVNRLGPTVKKARKRAAEIDKKHVNWPQRYVSWFDPESET